MKVYFNSWNEKFKRPFGAICSNSTCKFNIKIEELNGQFDVKLVLFEDGKWERYQAKEYLLKKISDDVYSTEVKFLKIGYYFYYFEIIFNNKLLNIVLDPLTNNAKICNDTYNKWQVTVYDKELDCKKTGFENSVMYQIFPDSFYRDKVLQDGILPDRKIVETGYLNIVDDSSRVNVKNNTYYGGNIDGIRKKLPYLRELGINIIYLNPIFEAHSNHRYNTANFMQLDPLLGKNKDFTQFCDEAHKMGISIILDGVFNHVGADSIYFNKFKRYPNEGAFNSKSSIYYPWFKNNFFTYPNSYKGWWGDANGLPAVDTFSPEYIEYICGKNGVVKTWLERGADGFRLDVIDELPNEFIDILCDSIKKYGGKIIIGEVWEDATEKFDMYGTRRRYLLGEQIDTVMNYPFFNSAYNYIKYGDFLNIYAGTMRILEHYPKYSINLLMNLISTHDIERISNRLANEGKREFTREQIEFSRKMLPLLLTMQFTFPGIPCIYYGDEIAMMGRGNLENRKYFDWNCKDKTFINYIKELSNIKKNNLACSGDFKFLYLTQDLLIYKRNYLNNVLIIIINRSDKTYHLKDIEVLKSVLKNSNIIFTTSASNSIEKIYPYSAIIVDRF